ncbi:MAG: hypothetical protein IIC57_07675 [Proteobacteria bacterium]|nr:hypothetical protein [Pseudomonadota bacterium]
MILSAKQLDILIDMVDTKLSHMLVSGCDDRREVAVVKHCRLELREARAHHPVYDFARLRDHGSGRFGRTVPVPAHA